MGNSLPLVSRKSKTSSSTLPIDSVFKLPSPLPTWPPGEGFASGIIDLGGLQICQVSSFTKIWSTQEGGPDNAGATFFEPSSIPDGFFMLGCYSQPNNKPLFGSLIVAKDISNDPSKSILKEPVDYTLVWSSESAKIKQNGVAYIWLPTPPDGYKSLGHLVTTSPEKPYLGKTRCVRADFTDTCENDTWIWGPGKEIDTNSINIYSSRRTDRRSEALSVPVGTFIALNNNSASSLACLKNVKAYLTHMPNSDQIHALFQAYSPYIYFHPDEDFFPSSVAWFFENGALLYTKGQESSPIRIEPTGANLPLGGSNDDGYWLDLPTEDAKRERVQKGDVQNACSYLHVKPMLGNTYTDIAIWVFYPFNGPARAKVEFFNVYLGKIGEHVGDWEHITLRISNFNGELRSVYFSQHSKGTWVNAPDLEFQNRNKPVVYSSLHGHASYSKPGLVLQGNGSIFIRNDSGKGKVFMDTGTNYTMVNMAYLGATVFVEPPWLNYMRKWGPKVSYDIEEELRKVEKVLPGKLKSVFDRFVRNLPKEVLGEEGPTGPKEKDNWDGDETVADSAKDREECAESLAALVTCLPYVGGNAKAPTPDCCNGLKQVLKTNKKCLCVIIKDRNDPDLGLNINVTLALGLPTVCHAPANVSECPALLKLPPNSPDAQIFYQLNNTYSSQSPASSPTAGGPTAAAKANPTNAPVGASSSNPGKSAQQNSGAWPTKKRWLELDTFVGVLVVLLSLSIRYWV